MPVTLVPLPPDYDEDEYFLDEDEASEGFWDSLEDDE
jgi:hypothetical protein